MKALVQENADLVEIQEALVSDAKTLSGIQRDVWITTYINKEYGITKEAILGKGMGSSIHIAKWEETIVKPQSKTFIAKVNGIIVGFCFAKKEDNLSRIGSIYILKEFQGKGLGTKLIENAISYLGREKPIVLEVATFNQRAIHFYKKCGFEETGNEIAEEQMVRLQSGIVLPEIEMVLSAVS